MPEPSGLVVKPRQLLGEPSGLPASCSRMHEEGGTILRYSLTVNRRVREVEAEPDTPLLWVLRDGLKLTGTKYGCGIGVCGACTVLDGGKAARSCQVPVQLAVGLHITTIEGLSPDGGHPCQRAWLEEDVAQCGYCQPGMILEAAALLAARRRPTEEEVDAAFADHVCRCGTWQRVRRAVHSASRLASEGAARRGAPSEDRQ
jgi:isoquinoline 1-oxidoreductase alpha subunit